MAICHAKTSADNSSNTGHVAPFSITNSYPRIAVGFPSHISNYLLWIYRSHKVMIKALKCSVCSSGTNHVSISRFEFISASLISMLGVKLTARALLDHLLLGNRLSHSCCHVCTRPIRFTTADGSTRDITYTNTARAPLEALVVIPSLTIC